MAWIRGTISASPCSVSLNPSYIEPPGRRTAATFMLTLRNTMFLKARSFGKTSEGILAIDDVRYRVPGGGIINKLFVTGGLKRIFNYRRAKLLELLPAQPETR